MGTTAKVELLFIMMLLVALSHFLERDLRARARAAPPDLTLGSTEGPLFLDLDEPRPPDADAAGGGASPAAPPRAAERPTDEYEVRSGDTLSKIAKRFLGKSSRWQEIADLNRDRLRRPSDLKPGMRIVLPPREAVAARPEAR